MSVNIYFHSSVIIILNSCFKQLEKISPSKISISQDSDEMREKIDKRLRFMRALYSQNSIIQHNNRITNDDS